ncbi:hypothetical protein [Saccharopolyspora dendranthemae]|uniref:hypothetical protein n=1 Tax=Saccharopolyspora dendranthemae TaxID=1181886 RepID=UPI0011A39843|nr:hypothetical protein [Saccharopolyspora dendranthemae]
MNVPAQPLAGPAQRAGGTPGPVGVTAVTIPTAGDDAGAAGGPGTHRETATSPTTAAHSTAHTTAADR